MGGANREEQAITTDPWMVYWFEITNGNAWDYAGIAAASVSDALAIMHHDYAGPGVRIRFRCSEPGPQAPTVEQLPEADERGLLQPGEFLSEITPQRAAWLMRQLQTFELNPGMDDVGLSEEHDGTLTMGHEVLMSVSPAYRRLHSVSPADEAPDVVYAFLTSFRDSDYRDRYALAREGLSAFALEVFLPTVLRPLQHDEPELSF